MGKTSKKAKTPKPKSSLRAMLQEKFKRKPDRPKLLASHAPGKIKKWIGESDLPSLTGMRIKVKVTVSSAVDQCIRFDMEKRLELAFVDASDVVEIVTVDALGGTNSKKVPYAFLSKQLEVGQSVFAQVDLGGIPVAKVVKIWLADAPRALQNSVSGDSTTQITAPEQEVAGDAQPAKDNEELTTPPPEAAAAGEEVEEAALPAADKESAPAEVQRFLGRGTEMTDSELIMLFEKMCK